jgi:hypothetical protein
MLTNNLLMIEQDLAKLVNFYPNANGKWTLIMPNLES